MRPVEGPTKWRPCRQVVGIVRAQTVDQHSVVLAPRKLVEPDDHTVGQPFLDAVDVVEMRDGIRPRRSQCCNRTLATHAALKTLRFGPEPGRASESRLLNSPNALRAAVQPS